MRGKIFVFLGQDGETLSEGLGDPVGHVPGLDRGELSGRRAGELAQGAEANALVAAMTIGVMV